MHRRTELLVLVAALAACTSKPDGLTARQLAIAETFVSTTAPSPRYPLVAVFDQRVKLLGYDLDRTEWRPGEPLAVTWYWEVVAPPRRGSRLVTRLESPNGDTMQLDGGSPVRELFGPEHWRAGQFVRDEERLVLPSDWSASSVMLVVGLDVGERGDREGSGIALRTAARRLSSPGPSPTLRVVKTKTSPRLDGDLSDDAWRFAESTGPLARGSSGAPPESDASARLLWDSRFMYVGMEVRGLHSGPLTLSVEPAGSGVGLLEAEVSTNGAVTRPEGGSPGLRDAPGERSRVGRIRAAVLGRSDDSGSNQALGRTFEIAIPWQAFSLDGTAVTAPEVGDRWRFDVQVTLGTADDTRALSWPSRGDRDFHLSERFGILRFEGAPAEMKGSSAPIELPEGRMPAPMRRSADPKLRDSLLEQNAAEKRRIDTLRAKSRESQRLESSEDGH